MQSYEEAEINAIEEKKKRLHYESIRIEEIKKDNEKERGIVQEKIQVIEKKVFDVSRDESMMISAIDDKINVVDEEIKEIEKILTQKRK